MRNYDVAVIGSGPAGEAAAVSCAKAGMSVVVIEQHEQVGGSCTHFGTIPSKSLAHSVSLIQNARTCEITNRNLEQTRIDIPHVINHAKQSIRKQVILRNSNLERNKVDVLKGHASFVDKNTLIIETKVDKLSFKFKNAVIATGSSPYKPNDINFNCNNIFDSNSILELKSTPKSITIYGAGVIGCEYASIFRGLGLKVTLVNTRSALLEFLDGEISQAIHTYFSDDGITLINNDEYSKVTPDKDCVVTELKSGKKITSDIFLFANGRSGNTPSLNLDAIGLTTNSRGQINCDDEFRTGESNILAIGDVIGQSSLATSAFSQGTKVGNIIKRDYRPDIRIIPTGIYTSPEISCVGLTEEELTALGVKYVTGRALFKNLARAQIEKQERGLLKIIINPLTKEILGVHAIGNRSAEIIHIGQVLMESNSNNVEYLASGVFNYPTMAEAYRVAALNAINKTR